MSSVRTLLPIDLPALLACSELSTGNAAFPRERLGGEGQPTLEVLKDQISAFGRRRNAWVQMRRQRLVGLAGARRRRSNAAWEIDYLFDATGDGSATTSLLEHAIGQVGRRGAQKLFLRLGSESNLLQAARESGFLPVREETLYVREDGSGLDHAPADVRPALPADAYPLFRLYCSSVPESARRSEAATFDEWQAVQQRQNEPGLVLERDGAIKARVQACPLPHGTLVDVLLDASAQSELPGLISAALAAGPSGRPVFSLLPQTTGDLARAFESEGFSPYKRYVTLVRRTTKPLALPREVAVVAENPVGV